MLKRSKGTNARKELDGNIAVILQRRAKHFNPKNYYYGEENRIME